MFPVSPVSAFSFSAVSAFQHFSFLLFRSPISRRNAPISYQQPMGGARLEKN
jgi:hypothetical protein